MMEQTLKQVIQAANQVIQNKQFAIRCFQSMPVRLLGHSPSFRTSPTPRCPMIGGRARWVVELPAALGETRRTMDLSSRCHGSPHIPALPMLWHSGPATENLWTEVQLTLDLMCLTPKQTMEMEELSSLALGDYSKAFLLQTVDRKHQDLKYTSPEMMVALVMGKFSNIMDKFMIVDCRYPYEYEGGYIKTAVNLLLKCNVQSFLLQTPITPCNLGKRVILIFHCKFSLECKPHMCRFIRERDRAVTDYPSFYYPKMYIMKES
ncbi:hypothetical protein P7K49_038254 [Saguinus oedipus]|uniref:protein-tyrosine-phosphatase n=1 Tax=Saguinus oedipus TaxID=9490 RepID=A0ABQ9TEY3_SAGOE|nr:hypothetical protein P7K49_038254 [Saguinus oedipus]